MKVKPADRRKFANEWDQVGYLHDKLLYWLYQRQDAGKARPYAERLECLLARVDPRQEAILGEECRSLIRETKGDLGKAIEHREREIRLIRRLYKLSRKTPFEAVALKGYGPQDLADRLDLLAILYHDSGHLDRAIRTLRQSRRLAEKDGIKFDGKEILEGYLKEKNNSQGGSAAIRSHMQGETAERRARKSG
jgi:hypothetical protein